MSLDSTSLSSDVLLTSPLLPATSVVFLSRSFPAPTGYERLCMAADMVLLRATREEAVVFEVEDIEADERLWLRVTPA